MTTKAAEDTICAIATPPGAGGIGVVRISGPRAREVLTALWRGRVHPSQFEARKLYLGSITLPLCKGESEGVDRTVSTSPNPSLQRRGITDTIHGSRITLHGFHDKALAVFMPSPHTYTGDDVVEISCHGSQIILSRILEACGAAGARIAAPGEFTRRAFLAGKLDLAQAEAVADLIGATSERGARQASEQLEGRLSAEVREAGSRLADIRAVVEASIDFPEEGIEQWCGDIADRINDVASRVKKLTATYGCGRMIRDGVRVAIVGRPNSGKSSLMNRLAGRDRALVHHEPGTTRDVIEERVQIGGVEFRLRDTAGVRDAGCEVEALGIARTREEIALADLVLAVFDGSREFGKEDEEVMACVCARPAITIINKSDLPERLKLPSHDAQGIPLRISALTGMGMDDLSARLAAAVLSEDNIAGAHESAIVTSARHKAALDDALTALKGGSDALAANDPIECIAQHLRSAQDALGSITGEVTTDELLDRIFSRFCIGK